MNSTITANVGPLNVLLIEDSADDIFLVQKLLVQSGLNVNLQVIRDGEEALNFLLRQQNLPQVVLLDLSLPKITGVEILQRVKADSLLEGIPVIVISGTDREEEIRFEPGSVHSHISKPISIDEFSWIVRSMENYLLRIERMETEWGSAWLNRLA